MRKILISVLSGCLVLLAGSGVALGQDQELVSKVVPVEVWTCNYKEGHGPADIDAATDAWNGYMDENNVDSYAAWTLTKSYYGPDQEFDVIWLGAWTDGNAMGTVSDMMEKTGGEYLAKFFVAVDCATHSNLASLNYKMPGDGTISNGLLTISNCSIEDEVSFDAVATATSAWADVLTEAGSESAIYHWFPIYGGGGDEGPDFVWVDSYADNAAMGADYERRGNGGLFRKSTELLGGLVDCDVPRVYNAQSRRTAKIR